VVALLPLVALLLELVALAYGAEFDLHSVPQ